MCVVFINAISIQLSHHSTLFIETIVNKCRKRVMWFFLKNFETLNLSVFFLSRFEAESLTKKVHSTHLED